MFSQEQYSALRHNAALVDRSHRGRIVLTGADRRSYLQGLLTNDIAALEPGTGCYAALLTPQGRMIADMRVIETGDRVVIDLPAEVRGAVHGRLEQFIFSEDVQVADISESVDQIGMYGPSAAGALSKALGVGTGLSAPALDRMAIFANAHAAVEGAPALIVRSDEIGVSGFEVFVDSSVAATLRRELHACGVIDADPATVEIVRIEAGRPLFGVDMDNDTIPLEAGIEDRAISLTKGCYVGQEIIIRVLHRGHGRVARRLVGMAFASSASPPSRGDRIRSGEREVGSITSAAMSPALGRPVALGYVHRDFAQPGTAIDVAGQPGTVASVPFVAEQSVRR